VSSRRPHIVGPLREGGEGSSIGVDSHKCSLAAAAVDELGRVIGVREFPNDPQGHAALLTWAPGQPAPRAIGVEGSGTTARGSVARFPLPESRCWRCPRP
jgi:hypothetical protein